MDLSTQLGSYVYYLIIFPFSTSASQDIIYNILLSFCHASCYIYAPLKSYLKVVVPVLSPVLPV